MADGHDMPSWLDEKFFENMLRKREASNEIKIIDLSVTTGTAKSDHYASIMFRAKVKYMSTPPNAITGVQKEQSMIIKTTPITEGPKKEAFTKTKLFETEIGMYSETLPNFERILMEHDDATKLCAEMLYHSLEPHKCVIFEDLTINGYTTITNGWCSLEEVKMGLLKLAKIHAISYKLHNEGDVSLSSYKYGSFNTMDINEFNLTKNSIKLFKEVLQQYEDLQLYLPHVVKIEHSLHKGMYNLFDAYFRGDKTGIFVLTHGDLHMKNAMYKRDQFNKNKLGDVLLIDFQLSVFGSVAIDLFFFFVAFFSPDMRLNKRDELFNYYFKNFRETLEQLNFNGKVPTLLDLHMELKKHRHAEIFMFMTLTVMQHAFSTNEDIDRIFEDEVFRRSIQRRPEYLQELRSLLPMYLHKGYFEP
ncbi:uncharacterized protein LOC119678989 [Teleopsis dalmanni]|uniref:uncharacterized protein LOC119678989 n=1 Tax=Teleopsis dalmanni TaxID=139649 RepID=UPI0018CCA9F7|nr:uncharacterized protein LOC119678989 [Teleopsis dalmanni]